MPDCVSYDIIGSCPGLHDLGARNPRLLRNSNFLLQTPVRHLGGRWAGFWKESTGTPTHFPHNFSDSSPFPCLLPEVPCRLRT